MELVQYLFIKNYSYCVKVLSILTLKWRGEDTFYKELYGVYSFSYNQLLVRKIGSFYSFTTNSYQ